MGARVRVLLCVLVACAAVCVAPAAAFAFDETTSTIPPFNEANCGRCHNPYFSIGACIHGGYTTTSTKCKSCHDVHAAANGSIMLLPAATIQATCLTCHDGTQGQGVYGAIAKRGLVVGAQHRCETTNVVPGGNRLTGGDATMTLGGMNGTLSCDDCHSPHAASVVATFTNERPRYIGWGPMTGRWTNNLLKQRPGDSTSSTTVYGSDWCGACHKGRLTGSGMPNNHPVESTLTTSNANRYERVTRLASDSPTSATVVGSLGQTNRGYLMPFPRTSSQQNHGPICQQCHEDSRNVGSLDTTGMVGDPATWTVTNGDGLPDGATSPDNPRFQNFPHETVNTRFLVETYDDLCLNCHPPTQLP